MLKLVHEVAWQFAKNLWMKLFGKLDSAWSCLAI